MVQRASANADEELVFSGFMVWDVFVAQDFRATEFVDADGFHSQKLSQRVDNILKRRGRKETPQRTRRKILNHEGREGRRRKEADCSGRDEKCFDWN
jgi:hypothetical protein